MKIINTNDKKIKDEIEKKFQQWVDLTTELVLDIEQYGDVNHMWVEVWGKKNKYLVGVK